MPSEHSDSDEQDPAVCKFQILCYVCSEDTMARRKQTGSDLEVSEMSGLHTEYITAGEQLVQLFWPMKIYAHYTKIK